MLGSRQPLEQMVLGKLISMYRRLKLGSYLSSYTKINLKNVPKAGCQWLTTVILVPQEAEIRRIMV
jgi:hypothetical protein